MATTLPFPIPDNILLLVHLHLLEWPQDDVCDPDMFNATSHGIGDRIKAMERVVYFLIAKAEGDQHAKALLPMFPCKQPSDTVNFRNIVTKYLETLRAAAIKSQQAAAKASPNAGFTKPTESQVRKTVTEKARLPPRKPAVSARSVSTTSSLRTASTSTTSSRWTNASSRSVSASSTKSGASSATMVSSRSTASAKPVRQKDVFGWWWKDVPVRKSLLEESTGPRFERLLLALSAHALLASREATSKEYTEILQSINASSNNNLFDILAEQPEEYRAIVDRIKDVQLRVVLERELLLQRSRQIDAFRAGSDADDTETQVRSIQELQTSKGDLLSSTRSSLGSDNLNMEWMFSLVGLTNADSDPTTSQSTEPSKRRKSTRMTILPPAPLPTAVAQLQTQFKAIFDVDVRIKQLSEDLDTYSASSKTRSNDEPLSEQAECLENEAALLRSVQDFTKEMTQLESLMTQELAMRQAALNEVYELEHQVTPTKNKIPSDRERTFELDFDISKGRAYISQYLHQNRLSREELAQSIQSSIHADLVQRDESSEESDGEEEGATAMADETVVFERTSPIKSRIPTYSTPYKSKISTDQSPKSTRTPRGLVVPKAPQLLYLSRVSPPRTPQYATAKQRTPVRATPSFFMTPTRGMEDLKDILPPFQSPWRSVTRSTAYHARNTPRKSVGMTPRKSIGRKSIGQRRISGHRPRLSKGLMGSSSFVRTPLKSGKRLSSIIPPVSYSAVPMHATPRASLDDVYEEIVDDLVQSSKLRTPPSSTSGQRLLGLDNSVRRTSPYKRMAGQVEAQSPDGISEYDHVVSDAAEWDDVLEEEQTKTPRKEDAGLNEPSFTLQDILLRVGQQGLMGANGTFNFDLLNGDDIDVEDDEESMLGL